MPSDLSDVGVPVTMLNYNVVLEPHRSKTVPASFYWNYLDTMRFYSIHFDVPPMIDDDTAGDIPVDYKIQHADSVLAVGKFEVEGTSGFPLSVQLLYDAPGAWLKIGYKNWSTPIAVPFDARTTGKFGVSTSLKISDNDLIAVQGADFGAVETNIDTLIAQSKDSLVGYWDYFDRNTDIDRVEYHPQKYAVVPAKTKGQYLIVYVGEESALWKKGDIKATLEPTGFIGNYNMRWLTAKRALLSDDVSADYDSANRLLRLNFPLLKSSVRLRKLPLPTRGF